MFLDRCVSHHLAFVWLGVQRSGWAVSLGVPVPWIYCALEGAPRAPPGEGRGGKGRLGRVLAPSSKGRAFPILLRNLKPDLIVFNACPCIWEPKQYG